MINPDSKEWKEPIAAVPAGVVGHGREEGRANARLIAAAPELLAALQRAHMALLGYLPAHRNDITDAAIAEAAAAIARAQGGEA